MHQDHGQRGRRLGVYGVRTGGQGIPGSRRLPARRRLHRPPPAGPAGRAGEDRAEVHRRRPVPARRVPAEAGAQPGRGGRGLRERRGRGCEHRLRRPAGAHFRPQRHPGAEHRRAPRCQRRLQDPRRAEEGQPPRREDLRAGRRLPPRDERRQPAGRLRGAPGNLSAGAAHRRRYRPRHPLADRRFGLPQAPRSEEVHRRAFRPADRHRHPQGTRQARPRPAPGVQDRRVPGRRRKPQGPGARHDAGRRGDQRHQLRRLRRHRRPPGRSGAHLRAVGKVRQGPV
ncbi:hypothetical protein D9M71_485920 [compost metagenome]